MASRIDSDRRAHQKLSEHLSRHGLKQTRQREAILDAFLAVKGHVTSEELYDAVRTHNPAVGAATVYRAIKLFCEAGLARAHHFRDGVTLYEREGHHHDHLICQGCGAIVEFEREAIEEEQVKVAAQHGYLLKQHRHILYGICPRCQKKG
ncbi:MAG: transcriptional repressor [Deltaproteobacteria bacterium]|nr:transcriptional repressor [Deltaproteobacteria bacterium]